MSSDNVYEWVPLSPSSHGYKRSELIDSEDELEQTLGIRLPPISLQPYGYLNRANQSRAAHEQINARSMTAVS